MATYKQIQNFVQEHHSVNVQTCWIAHMKEKCGLPRRKAPNRISEDSRVKPCPLNMRNILKMRLSILE